MKLILFLLPFTFLISRADAQAPRPNILYFYVDDMGWGSIGPNGQADRRRQGLPSVQTPHIDRLAAEGVNFRRGYACTVCSPSRASQQTGFHQGHSFSDRNDPDNAKKAMRTDDLTMGDLLSEAGYATGYWGKWGYGGSRDMQQPTIDNVQTLPTSHGYQHVLAELHHVRAHTFFQPTLWSAPANPGAFGGLELVPNSLQHLQGNPRYSDSATHHDHPDYPSIAYCDDSYAFAALDFVREQGQRYATSGQPFFGLFAAQIPHAPFGDVAALPEWDGAYRADPQFQNLAEQSREWAAMVTRIDTHFGDILAALEDPNADGDKSDSIAKNTLVIFQSDNGGPGGRNNLQLDANGGLRGVKGSIYEGGIRVPLVMKWPLQIHQESQLKAGSNSDMVVDITDLLPTFCELAGITAPLGIDGVSIAPTLTGVGTQRDRNFIIHEAGKSQSIIQGDRKLIQSKKGALQLYDLTNDPAEDKNIADQFPNVVRELQQTLLAERVTEPKGFANTYHHWIGPDRGDAVAADHWSDYTYANAGVAYMTDSGSPQLSWIAKLHNSSNVPNTAVASSDLEFLGLEVGGGAESSASQTLRIANGVDVTGRNEVRVGSSGVLELNGGRITSLRWVDVLEGGRLTGDGTVNASLFNGGTLTVEPSANPALMIEGHFEQSSIGRLQLSLGEAGLGAVQVKGKANVNGSLEVVAAADLLRATDGPITVLSASSLTGKFANPRSVVRLEGQDFDILYSQTQVKLKRRAAGQ